MCVCVYVYINTHTHTHAHTHTHTHIYIYIYIGSAFSKFPDILYKHLKFGLTLENPVYYCYTSYEMTDQFLLFQVHMNIYSSNWNTPY